MPAGPVVAPLRHEVAGRPARTGSPFAVRGRGLDDDEDFAALPRRRAGSAPQNLTVMLLAEYGLRHRAWFPSAAIVTLLGEFGVGPANARAAISRLARRGVLERSQSGRFTSYRLAPSAAATLAEGGRLLAGFDAVAESWDGSWTLVAFSLPQGRESDRRALRNQLRWSGFAPLYDGLWVSPRALPADAWARVAAVAPATVTVFRATQLRVPDLLGRDPLRAWNLPEIAGEYREFLACWRAPAGDPSPVGRRTGAEAMRTRMALLTGYRPLPLSDPPVPARLMPPHWPRRRAQRIFTAVYDILREPACDHVLDVVAAAGGDPDAGIAAHTAAELAAGIPVGEPRARTAGCRWA